MTEEETLKHYIDALRIEHSKIEVKNQNDFDDGQMQAITNIASAMKRHLALRFD